jgi:hypothetical protein
LFLHEGDSLHEVPKFHKENKVSFDLVYIGSTKALDISNGNFFNSIPLIHYKTFIIFDNPYIQFLWDGYKNDKTIKEIEHNFPSELHTGYFLEGPEDF